MATGPVCPLLVHAARQCFWQLPRVVLQKLASFRRLGSRWPSELLLLRALLESILGELDEEAVLRLLQLRPPGTPVLTSDFLPPEISREMAHPDDLKDLKDSRPPPDDDMTARLSDA